MSRPRAIVSVDVDPVDLHLIGYGFTGLPADPLVYTHALPRLLDVFAKCGVRATLFLVGRDAAAHAGALRAAAEAGHEIASHTHSHPIGFAGLGRVRQEQELGDSKRGLEAATGATVIGFRSPNFDMNAGVVPVLAGLGYRYDASAYPTPMLVPARLVLATKSADPMRVLAMRPWPFTWKREPHDWTAGGATIREFPLAVTPSLRMPVYHTLRYFSDDASFAAQLDGFAARGDTLSYALHAVDVLGLREDSVDGRLAKHPGMDRKLAFKLELLERSLKAIAARFDVVTYAELV
ncbi:MAG: polysaccharide deacetylase family protein [Candidatus Eisenbacteria bacterium]